MKILSLATAFSVSMAAFAGDLPDLDKTPGKGRADITKARICEVKWGKDERHVSQTMKDQVFALYGFSGNTDRRCVPDARGRRCEVDHLISRELGGADVLENLWPEAYGTSPYNAQKKDTLEN